MTRTKSCDLGQIDHPLIPPKTFVSLVERCALFTEEIDNMYIGYTFESFLKSWLEYRDLLKVEGTNAEWERMAPILYYQAHSILSCLENPSQNKKSTVN